MDGDGDVVIIQVVVSDVLRCVRIGTVLIYNESKKVVWLTLKAAASDLEKDTIGHFYPYIRQSRSLCIITQYESINVSIAMDCCHLWISFLLILNILAVFFKSCSRSFCDHQTHIESE